MIYFIKPENINVVKIGQSDSPFERLTSLQTGSWEKLNIIRKIKNSDREGEKIIHNYLVSYRTFSNNEWYHLNGNITDNRIENLMLTDRAEHIIKYHPYIGVTTRFGNKLASQRC